MYYVLTRCIRKRTGQCLSLITHLRFLILLQLCFMYSLGCYFDAFEFDHTFAMQGLNRMSWEYHRRQKVIGVKEKVSVFKKLEFYGLAKC